MIRGEKVLCAGEQAKIGSIVANFGHAQAGMLGGYNARRLGCWEKGMRFRNQSSEM